MDQLYTVNEMMALLKVSRATIYNYCDRGVLPYVPLEGGKRFIGSQVMKALKDLQSKEVQNKIRGESSLVSKDTSSDVRHKLTKLSRSASKDLAKLKTRSYKIRDSKSVKHPR